MIQIEVINNKRIIKPYRFVFRMRAKPIWKGFTINEIYSKFYPEIEFNINNIKLNSQIVENGYVLKENDLIEHVYHNRIEPSVSNELDILFENNDYLVVHKPAMMPVHPCGRFHYNSLLKILEFKGFHGLHTIHRLDLQTEGVVIFARNKESARNLSKLFKEKLVIKNYLAQVCGKFSEHFICEEPITNRKGTKSTVDSNGKYAKSIFTLIKYDSSTDTSLIKCKPITGRTHQLRVHLNYLNHPILNDSLYGKILNHSDQAMMLLAESIEFNNFKFKIKKYPDWVTF